MAEVNQFLEIPSNMLMVWLTILILSLIVAKIIARRFKSGWLRTIGLLPLIILTAVLFGGAVSLLLVGYFHGARLLDIALTNPAGLVAYFVETGIEYSGLTIPISSLGFLFYRSRGRGRSNPMESSD